MTPRPRPERAAPVVDRRPVILIADGDRVSERTVELALAPCDFTVEWARDGGAALDTMRQSKTDLVIADSVLSDMSGAVLMRRTFEACGPGAPAFIFLTIDRAVATRVTLLSAGAADFVIKPFAADELRARVVNTIEQRRPTRTAVARGRAGLTGDCDSVSVADLLTLLEFGRRSGSVDVSVGPSSGRLVIDAGRVVHAELGTLSGEEAFFALLRASGGLFRFEQGSFDVPHTLNARVSELLLESAVREDTDRHEVDSDARRRTEAGLRALGIVKTPVKLRRRRDASPAVPSLVPAGQRLCVAVADAFSVGDLAFGAEAAADAGPLLRVELWAALSEGVMAMLSLASPPGYRFVLAALEGERERLHLRFETAGAALVVTLVDTDGSSELPVSPPHGIIVAPPGGELISLAPQRLAELTGRLGSDDGIAVLALGGPALQASIGQLVGRCDGPPRAHGIGSTLESDPRETLCSLLRLWLAHHGDAG
jgi:CheY-like chemotaxis protein